MIVNSRDVWDGTHVGAVSLTFDDGGPSQLERAAPLLDPSSLALKGENPDGTRGS